MCWDEETWPWRIDHLQTNNLQALEDAQEHYLTQATPWALTAVGFPTGGWMVMVSGVCWTGCPLVTLLHGCRWQNLSKLVTIASDKTTALCVDVIWVVSFPGRYFASNPDLPLLVQTWTGVPPRQSLGVLITIGFRGLHHLWVSLFVCGWCHLTVGCCSKEMEHKSEKLLQLCWSCP